MGRESGNVQAQIEKSNGTFTYLIIVHTNSKKKNNQKKQKTKTNKKQQQSFTNIK